MGMSATAFFTSRHASKSETDKRLEYLFWRVWSSQSLLAHTNVQYLNRLVSRIMVPCEPSPQQLSPKHERDSAPLLRLPVDPLPLTSTISHLNQQPLHHLNQTPHSELTQNLYKMDNTPRLVPQALSKPQPMNDPKSPLHSILKKPGTAQTEHQKTTRLLLERPNGTSVTRNPSTPPTPGTGDHPAKEGTAGRQTTPKRAHFTTSRTARGTHRRPAFNRRKSTQTSVPKVSSPPRPRLAHSQPVNSHDSFYEDGFMQLDWNVDSSDSAEGDVVTSWANFDPFDAPIRLSQRFNESITPPEIDLITEKYHPPKKTNISASDLADKLDPILLQGIETVSLYPEPTDKDNQQAEIQYRSISSTHRKYYTELPEGADVPGFTGAKRIPMPENMMDDLVSIITNTQPVEGEITVPSQPWVWCEGFWRKPTAKQPLHDWMIRDEYLSPNPQPSYKPLVGKGFRKKFAVWLQGVIAREENQKVQDGLSTAHGQETKQGHKESDNLTAAHAPSL